ncbi:MAG: hypothetical protein Q9222_006069 [Ikaeria aurantiellina]
MSEADGIGFVKGALREAIKWDGSSGGVIRMVVLTDKGAKRLLYLPDQGYDGPGEIPSFRLVALDRSQVLENLDSDRIRRSATVSLGRIQKLGMLQQYAEAREFCGPANSQYDAKRPSHLELPTSRAVVHHQLPTSEFATALAALGAPSPFLHMTDADMGTAILSDPITDATRFHPTMVIGDTIQTSSRRSESTRNLAGLAQSSRLPNSVSAQARIPSTSSTPTQATFPTTRPKSGSHHVQSTTPIAVPPSRGQPQQSQPEPTHTHPLQQAENAEAPFGYDQNGFPLTSNPQGLTSTPPSPRLQPTQRSMLSFSGSGSSSPNRIKVRDLNHIQSFASEEVLARSRHGSRHSLRGKQEIGQQYEISAMPVTDIIEMVAGLLTKITTTNDRQHESIHRHIPPPEGTSGLSQQSSSVLAFHGKNVPSITILSYLSRIHKYCPTTYEVFLSLLVYFDRMTETVNSGSLRSLRDNEVLSNPNSPDSTRTGKTDMPAGLSSPATTSSSPTSVDSTSDTMKTSPTHRPAPYPPPPTYEEEAYSLSHFFVVDSFNIHRLVISAVGGLPLVELNHLELQFLLLNDFRLSVPVEELEAYGTMLVEFYAREVVAQQQQQQQAGNGGSAMADALYMNSTT